MPTPLRAPLFASVFFCWGLCLCTLSSLGLGSARAETSAVVGFYDVAVPAGNSAWVCGLVGADLFSAAAIAVSADVDGKALVQFSSPDWSAGEFPLHYAEVQSGASAGLPLNILSNTADTLKLDTTPAAAGLTSGLTFIVRKHATLRGLLPDGGGFLPGADTFCLFGSNGLQTLYYFSDATNTWITVLNEDSSDVVVRPGQGFVIHLTAPKTITFGKGDICHLKTTPTKVRVQPNVPNIIGALNPLGNGTSTLGALGVSSDMQAFNDSVVTLSPGPLMQTGTYLSSGTALINSGSGANANSVSIPAGAGVVINVNAGKNITTAPVSVTP